MQFWDAQITLSARYNWTLLVQPGSEGNRIEHAARPLLFGQVSSVSKKLHTYFKTEWLGSAAGCSLHNC